MDNSGETSPSSIRAGATSGEESSLQPPSLPQPEPPARAAIYFSVRHTEEDASKMPSCARRSEEGRAPPRPLLPRWVLVSAALLLYHGYLALGVARTWHRADASWCDRVRFLCVLTALVYVIVALRHLLAWAQTRLLPSGLFASGSTAPRQGSLLQFNELFGPNYDLAAPSQATLRQILLAGISLTAVGLLVMDSMDSIARLQAVSGLLALIFFGYLFSYNRDMIAWGLVMRGVFVQYAIGVAVLRLEFGRSVVACVTQKVTNVLEYPRTGAQHFFGELLNGINMSEHLGTFAFGRNVTDVAPVFVFTMAPVIVYVSFCVSVLQHYGIMRTLTGFVGSFLQNTIGVTLCESICAASNVFVGMFAAQLVIEPSLTRATKSELHAILTSGFSCIAGTMLAAYITLGIDSTHLVNASLLSAPASLTLSKIVYPETENIISDYIEPAPSPGASLMEAVANSTGVAVRMVANIAANTVGALVCVKLVDGVFSWILANVNIHGFALEKLLAIVLTPSAMLMGVPWEDCWMAGRLLGMKMIANEFIAYAHLIKYKDTMKERSVVLLTYAMCSFGNLGAVSMMLGAMNVLCPPRIEDASKMVLRALCSGIASSFMTTCVAGSLLTGLSDEKGP
ncbi:putative transporter YutK [Haemaphysalis longicornis]